MSDELDRLVAAVRASAKYGGLAESLIRTVGAKELTHRPDLKAAIKATKGKLHQVMVADPSPGADYADALASLRDGSAGGDREALRPVCARLMARHASTRERLPILDQFYRMLLGPLGPITAVLDLACGLNPLALPWMPLATGCVYHAYDVDLGLASFLEAALPLLGVQGRMHVTNLATDVVTEAADVALLLKCVPCLERLDRMVGRRLLTSLPVRCLIVSYPVASLGGRGKGMVTHYEAHLRALVAGQPWTAERFLFPTELAFRLTPRPA